MVSGAIFMPMSAIGPDAFVLPVAMVTVMVLAWTVEKPIPTPTNSARSKTTICLARGFMDIG
jgi:hypothetical protein